MNGTILWNFLLKVVKTSEGFTHVTIANRTKVVPPYDQFQNLALQPRYQMQHEQRPNSRVSVLQLYIMGKSVVSSDITVTS